MIHFNITLPSTPGLPGALLPSGVLTKTQYEVHVPLPLGRRTKVSVRGLV